MGWYGNEPGWGGWVVMVLMMLGFWALVGVAVVALVRGSSSSETRRGRDAGRDRDSGDGATRILDERLARGEIDVEEYQTRRAALASSTRR